MICPMQRKCINVPYINQSEQWPTGCESVSTVMALQHLGIDIDVDTWITYLPKTEIGLCAGQLVGGDPNIHFIGSPYDADAYGCYAPVIVNALNSVFKTYDVPWKAVDVTAMDTDVLLKKYIDRDMPVIYWATIDLKESYKGPVWRMYDSDLTFEWTSNEHCMLLVGYDDDYLIFNDPWNNHGVIDYERRLVEERHKEMFSMAVAIESCRSLHIWSNE